MKVEKGTLSDLDELEKLYDALNDYMASTVNYPGWIKHIYPVCETARKGIEEGSLFVLKANQRIAGTVILNHTPEEAYHQVAWEEDLDYSDVLVVRTLVIHPDFLQKKIATALLEFAKEYAIQKRIRSIRLDVSENNLPAIRLYEKMGYQYRGMVDLGLPYEHLKWFRLYEYCPGT